MAEVLDESQELLLEALVANLALHSFALRHTKALIAANFSHVGDRILQVGSDLGQLLL